MYGATLFWPGVGSGTSDVRSRRRPKKWWLRNTDKKFIPKHICCLIQIVCNTTGFVFFLESGNILNILGEAPAAPVEHPGAGVLPAGAPPRLCQDPGGGHQLQVQGLRGIRQGSDGGLRHAGSLFCTG